MTKHIHGPALYYASDKNILDALNQHKVTVPAIRELLLERGIITSKSTSKSELARFFSRLTHDHYDQEKISALLGIATRRERTSTDFLTTASPKEELEDAAKEIKTTLEEHGDTARVSIHNGKITLEIEYIEIDYTKTEFRQIAHRDGKIEIIPDSSGYTIRNTQNDYIKNIKDTLLSKFKSKATQPVTHNPINLTTITSHKLRSRFFDLLIEGIDGHPLDDVSSAYVYKNHPTLDDDTEDDTEEDSRIERVSLKGIGVSRSIEIKSLYDRSFYLIKVIWIVKETLGLGHKYELEAIFADPINCSEFSYALKGVYEYRDGHYSKTKRQPTYSERENFAYLIEKSAKKAIITL